jgi:ATP-dependent DNA helicase RecG
LIGITERSVERNIQKLQEQNKLIRVGGAKGGFWEIPK